jgi:hypothetical protein
VSGVSRRPGVCFSNTILKLYFRIGFNHSRQKEGMKIKSNKGISCCQTERGTPKKEQGRKRHYSPHALKRKPSLLGTAYYQVRKLWGWA